jgi:hypothetical protein
MYMNNIWMCSAFDFKSSNLNIADEWKSLLSSTLGRVLLFDGNKGNHGTMKTPGSCLV